ncbi:SusD/RagB family nutrient-binding outer membrane lipoprotein [Fulvivirgaceae bacterium BMA10]|uniref:SusD/RagB family nutrient-binding outer membrane lipoprotein n=1 Tax=Splendidivirga corallicola TaxID=3051826 RepID=A0ABT8KKM6_9BACT|nr:SusD/RagB family nutrient-binding outer membrane lipoprotein [Fulvivirgaceae bacterium BMA10]
MKKVIYNILVATLVVAGFNGCTDNFEETNTNPRVLTEDFLVENPSVLGQAFAQSQYTSLNGLHWRFQISQNLFSDLWCQYYATTAVNFPSDRYTQVGRWADLAWSSFYGQAAPQIKLVEDLSEQAGEDALNAVAKIWRVHGYHRMTDYWGPVIYSSYGNVDFEQANITVPYDSQQDIYNDFFTTLDEAVSVLKANTSAAIFPSDDRVYGGDAAKWLRFANSLRLRLAMRIRYADPAKAQAEAEKAVADGVIESISDEAQVAVDGQNRNPLTTITNWGEFRMSAAMESVLKGYDDPRLPTYFSPAVSGDSDGDSNPYEGLLNGQTQVALGVSQNDLNSDVATRFLNDARGGSNPPLVVLRASEVAFLRAEGALVGWNMGGTEQDFYEEGIRLSMQENAAEGDVDAYIASTATPVPYAPGTDPLTDIPVAYDAGGSLERRLEQIITQKWLALYPNGWEAWAELRRTGYPRQYARSASDNPDVGIADVVRRMVFVSGEFTTNGPEVEKAIGLLSGADKNNTKVWWDKK